jgi:hypothetical protein
MTPTELTGLPVSAILLLGAVQKGRELWRDRGNPLRRAVFVCLASLAAATIFQLCTSTIDAWTGVARLGKIFSDIAAMTAACAGRLFLIHVNYPPPIARRRRRRRYVEYLVAVAAYIALFAVLPPGRDPLGRPAQPVAYYAYICYLAITFTSVCHLGVRYANLTDQPFLRIGLRVMAAGSICGLVFLAVQGVEMAANEAGRPLGRSGGPPAWPFELLTQALLLVGVTIPAWGARLADLARSVRDRRSHRALHPLWLALRRATPELVLVSPEEIGPRPRRRDLEFLLYRQVIEIRDGQLELRPYIDARVRPIAADLGRRAGLSDEDLQALGEAAAIAAGIAAKTAGRPPGDVSSEPEATPGGGADIAAEIAWLTKVSRAFARSPLVAAALAAVSSRDHVP